MAIVDEFGPQEMLHRLADPWWFQAFGCVLGFDWHSSGVTTVTCGAIKQAYKQHGADLGIIAAGGKGAAGRRTPREIQTAADKYAIVSGEKLEYASRMSAKVDSSAVQDGFSIYHHSFFLTPQGGWCVVQQGMSDVSNTARRYHWLGESVDDFVCEPHAGIENVESAPSPAQRTEPARLFQSVEPGGRGRRRQPPRSCGSNHRQPGLAAGPKSRHIRWAPRCLPLSGIGCWTSM